MWSDLCMALDPIRPTSLCLFPLPLELYKGFIIRSKTQWNSVESICSQNKDIYLITIYPVLVQQTQIWINEKGCQKNITLKMKELVYLYIYKLLSTNRTTTVAANQRACSEGSLGVAKLVIFCSKLKQSFPVASPTENFLARQNSFPDLNSSLIFIPLNFASPHAANHLSQKPPHTVKRSLS